LVDLKEIRRKLEAEEGEDSSEDEDADSILAGFVAPIPGWKKELDDFYVAAPLSIGSGILLALAFDYVRSKGNEDAQIFVGPWKDMAILTGSLMFGFGAGKLSRGVVAQAETVHQEKRLQEAEDKVQEAEDEKKAEEERRSNTAYTMLTDPTAFELAPSRNSLNIFGEYGSALGQPTMSYQMK
jgi:hypothetical protein